MEASRLDIPLRILTFAMVFLGILSVVLTGFLPPPEPLIVTALTVLGFFFWNSRLHTPKSSADSPPRPRLRHRLYDFLWYLLTVFFVLWCSGDLLTESFPGEDITVRVPLAAMRLSVFLQLFKVYNRKTDRDYIHMFLLSFFQFVSCAGVSVEFFLLLLLMVYLVLAIWTLALFHFRRQLSKPEARVAAPAISHLGHPRRGRLLTLGFFSGTLLASLFVAGMGALLFILFPRSATSDSPLALQGFFGRFGSRFTSGAEGPISLNMAGIINRNPAPVVTVALPTKTEPPHTILWRRGAFHHYDGNKNRWDRPSTFYRSRPDIPGESFRTPVDILLEKPSGLFVHASEAADFNSIADLRNDPELVPQKITLLHSYHRAAPVYSAFSTPVAVQTDAGDIACDVNESYRNLRPTRMNHTYTVYSRFPQSYSSRQAAPAKPPQPLHRIKRELYTQLPDNLHPRFRRLATQISQMFGNDYQRARAIRNYLTTNCVYSLDLTQKPGRNGPLYDFLFARKPGHCEYFASAMVILARYIGIPSRLAYGFSTGRWEPDRKLFVVRLLDAHAWAECYIEGRGWISLDPTPPILDDETPDTFFSLLLSPASGFLRKCSERWAEGVIGYNRFKQQVAYRFFTDVAKNIRRSATAVALFVKQIVSYPIELMSESLLFKILVPFAIAGFLILPVLLWLFVKRLVSRRRSLGADALHRRTFPTIKFYLRTLRLLMRRGITKKAADTPLEFAERAAAKNTAFSGVRTLTDLYYLVRFGNRELTDDQDRTIESILENLRRPPSPETPAD